MGRGVKRVAEAEKGKMIIWCEIVLGVFRRKMLVVVELKKLFIERGIIGEYADRIIVDLEASFSGFYNNARVWVADDPMEFGWG